MTSIIPSITGSVTAANVILTRILEVGDRRYITQQNKTEWQKLAKSYKTFADGIQHYETAIELAFSSESNLSNLDKEELNKLLTALDIAINDTKSELIDLNSRLDQESITTGSASTEQKRKGKSWFRRIRKVTTNPATTHAQRDEKTIKKLKENLENADKRLKEGKKLIEDKFGIFNSYFKNYYRSNNICLDYDNGEQKNASHEAKLKHTLLHPSNIGSSTQHSSVPRAVCVEGQGGMGKTTILKDICADKDMRKKFYDGIHFMTMGEGADDEQAKKEICRSLRNAGFGAVAAKLKDDYNLEDLASRASKIFQGRKVMLVVDDWHPEHTKYLKNFENMLCESKEGVLLVSSRYQQIGIRYEKVLFKELEPTGLTSRTILLNQAGYDNLHVESNNELKEAIEKILNACGGIKLCLAIAGSSILLQSRSTSHEERNAGIVQYSRDLERTSDQLLQKKGEEYKDNFSSIIDVSLGYCNEDIQILGCKDLKGEKKNCMKAKKLFKGFCVFEKQKAIPIHAISRLWDIEKDYATDVSKIMEYCRLLIIDRRKRCVEIHDKVLDVARIFAEKDGKECVRDFHKRILRGYFLLLKDWDDGGGARRTIVDELNEEGEQKKRMSGNEWDHMDWEVFNYPKKWKLGEEAEYFVGNVCRHLEEGEREKDLWNLVTKVWWTFKRRKMGGLSGIMSDFERLKRVCEGGKVEAEMEELFNREEQMGVEILMNQIRDGWMGILEDEHMIGFEIFGRVLKEDQRYKVVMKYLKSIELQGPQPWLRPVTAGLGRVDGRQIGQILTRHTIYCGSCVSTDCDFVVCRSSTGFEVIEIETQKRWWIEVGEGFELLSTSVCSKPLRVACGYEGGTVNVWDVENGELVGNTFNTDPEWVDCIAISSDGDLVVSGGSEGALWLWDVKKGEQVGEPLRGHDRTVYRANMSGDGNRVVSGGPDGAVRVWDVKEGEEACDPLTGHDGCVECVGISGDGNRVVSGGEDESVRVWDVKKGEQIGQPLRGHDGNLWVVGMSGDGNLVVSGGEDECVRVWDVRKGEQLGASFRFYGNRRIDNQWAGQEETIQSRYSKWLSDIRSCVAKHEELNDSAVCMKLLHQGNIPVLNDLYLSMNESFIQCDCNECESKDEKDKYSLGSEPLSLWIKDEYIYTHLRKSSKYAKVGRVDSDYCLKDGSTVVLGLRNGVVMVCQLQI